MACGLIDRVMKTTDVVALIDTREVPTLRGPYMKQNAEIPNETRPKMGKQGAALSLPTPLLLDVIGRIILSYVIDFVGTVGRARTADLLFHRQAL